MNELLSALVERVRREGAISFAEYMQTALYDPVGGFYSVEGRAGRRGDFLTSAEVGPLFGAVVARYLDERWADLGRPDPYVVVEVGAGPGTLARSVRAAVPESLSAMRYAAVEISSHQRRSHPDWVDSVESMPGRADVVIANELLDNLPFDVSDGSQLMSVDADGAALIERWPGGPPERRFPIQRAARSWIETALETASAGFVVVFDYMRESIADFEGQEWLRTYRGHQRGGSPLADPGFQDITADIALDRLIEGLRSPDVVTQADFLTRRGIVDLVDEGRRKWTEGAGRGDLVALRGRSRVAEAEALMDPAGLGAFTVLEWSPSHGGGILQQRVEDGPSGP